MSERTSRTKLLLIEDDEQLTDSLSLILKENGYQVSTCTSGRDSLDALKGNPFDALIIDVRLPDISGIEVLKTVKAEGLDICTLMLSGAATLEDAVESLNQGADAFILKPVDPGALIDRIERVMRVKNLQRRLVESEDRYRTLVESSSDGILALGLDWTIMFANGSFLEKMGLTLEEVRGRTFVSFIEPYQSTLLLMTLQGALQEGKAILPRFRIGRGDGSPMLVEASSALIRRDGKPLGVQMILREVTEDSNGGLKRDRAFKLNRVEQGESYIHNSRDSALRLFGNLLLHGVEGTIYTGDDPFNLVSDYGFDPMNVIVLISSPVDDYESVSDLGELTESLTSYLPEHNGSVILIDGLNAFPVHRFDEVSKFIHGVKQIFYREKSILIIPVDPATITDQEYATLLSELKLIRSG
ncbi:MAG TPA: response regulator [Patescibacteria group bacterium]|nr:response regulator [Patescibacteria group bacterium]